MSLNAIERLVLFTVITVAIAVGAYDVHRILIDLRTTINDTNETLSQAKQVIAKFDTVADDEKKSWNTSSNNTVDITKDARVVISQVSRILTRVDQQGGTVDMVNDQIKGNGNALQSTIKSMNLTVTKLGNTADGLTATTRSLDLRIQDPRVDALLDSFNTAAKELVASSHNLSLASASGASIMGRTDHVAAYYEKRLTTPLGFWKTLAQAGLHVGSEGAEIAIAFK